MAFVILYDLFLINTFFIDCLFAYLTNFMRNTYKYRCVYRFVKLRINSLIIFVLSVIQNTK